MRTTYPEVETEEIIAYGGASHSALWMQIKADVMGVPHVCLARDDLPAVGNVILAGYALGIYDDLAETSERFVKRTTRYEPRLDYHKWYRQYVEYYEQLLKQVEPSFAELATLPG
jgi:xylulokinase